MIGVDRHYGTAETAELLGRSKQWMYYCVRHNKFAYPPVWHVRGEKSDTWHQCADHPHDKLRGKFVSVDEPDLMLTTLSENERDMEWRNQNGTLRYRYFADLIHPILVGRRRRYSLPIIREIALSCYRQGNFKEEELKSVLSRIVLAEEN
jgi:hypothetical protein